MSSALLRQALEFVDQEDDSGKVKSKKRSGSTGQGLRKQFKNKPKKPHPTKSSEDQTEANIKKLLKLSQKVADDKIVGKIVERAFRGKPLTDFIEVKKAKEEKSILLPEGDESLREYFGD